ncbi:MAG TPA: hypothetical protein VGK48_08725 [Terriglobia bacterium]|jgi:hypothetical protein
MRVFFVCAFACALLLYSTGFFAPFMLDDPNVVQVGQHFGWYSRPLGYFSFWLNLQILPVIGPLFPWREPFYFRIVNVFIHACAATALFWLAWELIGRWLPASVAGALFLVHPIQTQAVTYVSQRFESMSALFMFLAAASYVKFRRIAYEGATGPRYAWLAATGLFAVAAATTKETAVILPLWLLFIEFVFFDRTKFRRAAAYILLVGLVLVYPAWKAFEGGAGVKTFGWIPWHQYFLTQGPILTKYFGLAIWPQRQFLFYDFQPVAGWSGPVVLEWLLVLAVLGAGFYLLKHDRTIGFGIITFLVLLIPMIVLPLPDLIMEHRLYPAFAGVAIAGAGVFQRMNRKVALTLFGILLVLYGVKTERRNADWNDQVHFMELHREAFPHDPQILARLAAYYYLNGEVNKALELNLESRRYEYRLNPYYRQQGELLTAVNLSYIYLAKHDFSAAKTESLRAIAAKPEDPNGWNSLGQTETQLGDAAAAERAFQKAVDLLPDSGSWQALEAAAQRAGDEATVRRADAALTTDAETAASQPPNHTLPIIPEKDRVYFIFVVTVGLVSAILWGGWTIWSAIHTAIGRSRDPHQLL